MIDKIPGSIEGKWFSEIDTMWPGLSLGLMVKKVLYAQKSRFQDILVFESESFGNVLVLDGVIQLSERDESAYQEMLAHLPLFVHQNPERVLIIGGGDGGVLREVIKHDCVEEVILCEIDQGVIDVSKEFFPTISTGFDNKKLKVIVGDGSEYMDENEEKFDVVIVDSSDPIGPANTLFTESFYLSIKNKLNTGGVVAVQGESLFLHRDLALNLKKIMSNIFRFTDYSQVHVPTYPGGNIGLLICSDLNDVKEPKRVISTKIVDSLKYYSCDVHKASFVLPPSYKV